MKEILEEIEKTADRCDKAAEAFNKEPTNSLFKRLHKAIESVGEGWSGSWLGYHAYVYIDGLRPKRPGEHFDSEWGLKHAFSNRTTGPWREHVFEEIESAILKLAKISDTTQIEKLSKNAEKIFEENKASLLPIFDVLQETYNESTLQDLRKQLGNLKSHIDRADIIIAGRPSHFMSRDSMAVTQGLQAPLHIQYQAWLFEMQSYENQLKELAKISRYALRYIKQKQRVPIMNTQNAKNSGNVFIGHGRSHIWKELKDFLQDRLKLPWDELNRESPAGVTAKERLEEMLENALFAFLVMTAEDEHADSSLHARENVIHEAGLFQGRLGFRRAIILLEDGCKTFSNIHGLQCIRFSKGQMKVAFEEIRQVLERERILK